MKALDNVNSTNPEDLPPENVVIYLGAITPGQKDAFKEIQLEIKYPFSLDKLSLDEYLTLQK